jgi:hypothetical protein
MPSQLIANVYMQNDGDGAQIVISTSSGLAPSTLDESKRSETIDAIKRILPAKGDIRFHVPAHEARWFTVPGPELSDEQKTKYLNGEYTFYFAGKILIQGGDALEFCAFVIGNNPTAIVSCPDKQ